MITPVRLSPCRLKCSVAAHPLHIVPRLNNQYIGVNKSLTPIHKPFSRRATPRAPTTNKTRHAQRAQKANLPRYFSQPPAMKHPKTSPKTPQASTNPFAYNIIPIPGSQGFSSRRSAEISDLARGLPCGVRRTTEARLGVWREPGWRGLWRKLELLITEA
jgi:hypothetical protein